MHAARSPAHCERCASLARRALIVVQAAQTVRRLPTGNVTFVMTDIEGSTRLFRDRGDEYVALLETHHDLLTQAFESHRGVEVATEGDGLVVVFDDAADAVQACLAGQVALRSHPWPSGADLRVRMGLHNAEATPKGNNYVSLGLHQAARICAGAHGGQIVLFRGDRIGRKGTAPFRRDPVPARLLPV